MEGLDKISKETKEEQKSIYKNMLNKICDNNKLFYENLYSKNLGKGNINDILNEFKDIFPHPMLIKDSPFYQNSTTERYIEIKDPNKKLIADPELDNNYIEL